MDFSKIPLFQGLVQKMGWLAQRQQVLARNIANANTPGFKPKDIEKPDFSALLEGQSRGSAAGRDGAAHGHQPGAYPGGARR
jgi:flagellar basal-body rod protein FlgB